MSAKAEIGFTRDLSAEERRLMQGLCDALQQLLNKQYQRHMWDCSIANVLGGDFNLGSIGDLPAVIGEHFNADQLGEINRSLATI